MTISQQQLKQFFDDGFLIVEGMFTKEELRPAMEELDRMVDRLAEHLFAAGRIGNKHSDKDLYTRLTAIDKEFPGAAMLFLLKTELGPCLADLWASEKLLDVVERIIGPDIAGHPVFAIRPKIPHSRLLTVPWHQDTAYLLPGAENTDQVTCWIPFTDVTARNGCMQYIRGAHRSRRVFRHRIESRAGDRSSPYLYMAEEDIPEGEVVTCEMEMGSALFHAQFSPHRSLENHSDEVRWSVDFRYQRPDLPTGLEGDSWVLLAMRRPDDPSFRPDLAAWLRDENRKRRADYFSQSGVDEFEIDPTGTDKTMERWATPAVRP